ncbi:coiled-coil domain-containing protein 117-like [Stigmatopora nigra]
MHHLVPTSSQLGFLPSMYTFSGSTILPESDHRSASTSGHQQNPAPLNNTWETRCLRKHRRRIDDDGCHPKRRRLAEEADSSHITTRLNWPPLDNSLQQEHRALQQLRPAPHNPTPLHASSSLSSPAAENSCMDIEAAQRTLQEIENRITLEDDDEDLDVEPNQRRPVLVISESLKEGLQRGINDILPPTIAQSVSHSCMELVLWRPPEDPFCRRLKGSLQKQKRQQTVLRQPPTPCISPTPHSPSADTHVPLQNFPDTERCVEEDMEM